MIWYLAFDNDEAKQVVVQNGKTGVGGSFKAGSEIEVKGIFDGMTAYKTETGLNKYIPAFTAEKIANK